VRACCPNRGARPPRALQCPNLQEFLEFSHRILLRTGSFLPLFDFGNSPLTLPAKCPPRLDSERRLRAAAHLTFVGARTFLTFLSARTCARPTADRNVRAPPDMFASLDEGEMRPSGGRAAVFVSGCRVNAAFRGQCQDAPIEVGGARKSLPFP